MLDLILTLPLPPSANRAWRNVGGRTLLSREGRAYRLAVAEAVTRDGHAGLISPTDRLDVHITLLPPDRRRRDLDNCRKLLLDALTKAGVWPDDSQIDRDSADRGEQVTGGAVVVRITASAQQKAAA
jgi:crossover junction endodeoxyribonuclease RusA